MKIEVGKKYKTIEGDIITIKKEDIKSAYPYLGSNNMTYLAKGSIWRNGKNKNDLIEEVIEMSLTIKTNEENKMEIKNMNKTNIKKAKEQFNKERATAETEEALKQLRNATNTIERLDREKKQYLETDKENRVEPNKIIKQFN